MDSLHSSVVEGMRLHWAECGTATDSVPLVLLHGLNDSHMTWKRIAPLLASGRRVLIPDFPGCGLSGRPDASYQLAWHAQVIARWLEKLGLHEIDVIGHSFGGGVGQMLLLEPALTVRRLGLVASGGLGPRVTFWLRLATLPGVEYFGQPFMAAGTRLALRAAGSRIHEEHIDRLSAMNSAAGTARAFARTVKDVISWRGQTRHFFQRAHEIRKLPPIALFWGDDDVITPLADALAFARTVDNVRLTRFAGCGHFLQHERPEDLALKLCAFLDSRYARRARLRVNARGVASNSIRERCSALIAALTSPQPLGTRTRRSGGLVIG
jgi:pimeloyl-ACP methyl ester carboxylesterase